MSGVKLDTATCVRRVRALYECWRVRCGEALVALGRSSLVSSLDRQTLRASGGTPPASPSRCRLSRTRMRTRCDTTRLLLCTCGSSATRSPVRCREVGITGVRLTHRRRRHHPALHGHRVARPVHRKERCAHYRLLLARVVSLTTVSASQLQCWSP